MLKPNYLLRIGFPSIFTCLVMIFSGCNGLPGDGGTSTITGKVFVERYNESGTLYQQYYGAEERVYIIYGDGTSFDDETKTSYDGTFQFPFHVSCITLILLRKLVNSLANIYFSIIILS